MRDTTRRGASGIFVLMAAAVAALGAGCLPGNGGGSGGSGGGSGGGAGSGGAGGGNPGACNGPELHLLGIYETHPNHGGGVHPPGAATVHVERQGPMILALSSYEPVNWTVTVEPGVTLEKVILSGYHAQTATVPAGVTVEDHSYIPSGDWLGSCAFYWPDSESGCNAVQVATELEQLTGRELGSFHGCYEATSFVLHEDLTVTMSCGGGSELPPANEVFDTCGGPSGDAVPDGGSSSSGGGVPPECDGLTGPGVYEGTTCEDGNTFITTTNIWCAEALENCLLNESLKPWLSFHCEFNGQVIHENELTPGVCAAF